MINVWKCRMVFFSSDAEQANQERATRPWPFFANGTATGESELITSCAKVAVTTPSVPPWFQGYQVQDMTRPASCSTSFQVHV
jgi:hypothetical protein